MHLGQRNMKVISIALFTVTVSIAAAIEFNYEDQTAWGDLSSSFCGIGRRQSPINIMPADVRESSALFQNLGFNGWDGTVDGVFSNTGHNVQFDPDQTGSTTIMNHKGTYVLQQFHIHWGRGQGRRDGSEHRVGGSQYDAEIHFVHRRRDAGSSAGDTLSVLGVFGVADSASPTGIWQLLMPMPTDFDSSLNVSGLTYSDLLPVNRDYYYYEGSLTTPLCDEIVQWFVFKDTIPIPTNFLAMLRTVQENENGTLLTHNVRDAQALNGRIVMTPSGASSVPIMSLLALCILALVVTFAH